MTRDAISAARAAGPADAAAAAAEAAPPPPPPPATDAASAEATAPTTVWRCVRGALGAAALQVGAFSVFINLLSLAIPVFVLQVYDRVVPHNGVETLKAFVLAVIAVVAFDFVLKQARSRVMQMIALRVDVTLSRRLFSRLCGLDMRALEARSDADWRAMFRDGDTVRDAVAGPAALLMIDLPFALLFIAVIGLVAPPLAWLLLAMTPVFIGLAMLSAWVVARASAAEREVGLEKIRLVEEAIAGRGATKAMGAAAAAAGRWERAQAREIRRALLRGAHVDGFSHLSGSTALLTTILMTTVGALAIMDQAMTIGGLIAANMLAARVVQPLGQIVGLARSLERLSAAAKRIDPVLAQAEEPAEAAVARPRPTGRLKIEKARFCYGPGHAPALDGASITFAPGAATGLLGANGSGKSTLLKVAQGLYAPDDGRVLLDGADLKQFGRAELARWIGYAPQETFLFAGTIHQNLTGGRPEAPDAAVLRAAAIAGAAGFIDALPDGYGTVIGDGGRALSAGQRQRLGLARALVDDPAILILDEPSAHLDLEGEAALAASFATLKRGRTLIVVSHSRALLKACDMLAVMHEGRIALAGPADEVLSGGPRVRRAARPAGGAAPAEAAPAGATPEDAAATTAGAEQARAS